MLSSDRIQFQNHYWNLHDLMIVENTDADSVFHAVEMNKGGVGTYVRDMFW